MNKVIPILSLSLLILFAACKDQSERDQHIIENYVNDNNLDAKSTGSGLWYVIENPGTGDQPTVNDEVRVYYKGYLTDGTVFDETTGQPAEFPLSQVIRGWQEGIPLFKEGGNGILLIPSELGYGDRAVGSIPANSVLVFEVELVEVL